jgi:hypothetical protein
MYLGQCRILPTTSAVIKMRAPRTSDLLAITAIISRSHAVLNVVSAKSFQWSRAARGDWIDCQIGQYHSTFGPLRVQRVSNAVQRLKIKSHIQDTEHVHHADNQSQTANDATCDRLVLDCPAPCTAILSLITPLDSQHE